MNTEQAIQYANNVGCNDEVVAWINTTFKNYVEKSPVSIVEGSQTRVKFTLVKKL